MFLGKPFEITMLILTFLVGIIAPVPECYVTRVVCPLKKSIACADVVSNNMSGTITDSRCCNKLKGTLDIQSLCRRATLKTWMRPYAPAFETAEAPTLPCSLLPVLFFEPFPRKAVFLAFDGVRQQHVPDPIPILLRKQSFLI